MIGLLILCLAVSALAVSNPEIATKSGKSPSPPSQKPSAQQQHDEPLLNSINAYAQQYESATPPKPYGITHIYSQPFTPSNNFKLANSPQQLPSSPTLEHNFQPMPSPHQQQQQPQIQAQHSPPTPIIMQYLPQTQMNDGMQYLQLIPARPLIVPISPYMSPMAQAAYQSPQIIAPQVNDYSGRPVLAPVEPDQANSIPYGLASYANNLQNYRAYRINRETKQNSIPTGIFLNINEYMPSPSDAPKPAAMIRGRP